MIKDNDEDIFQHCKKNEKCASGSRLLTWISETQETESNLECDLCRHQMFKMNLRESVKFEESPNIEKDP